MKAVGYDLLSERGQGLFGESHAIHRERKTDSGSGKVWSTASGKVLPEDQLFFQASLQILFL